MTAADLLARLPVPIIQAPMLGASGFDLALAVSRAGGLGSIPSAGSSPDEIEVHLGALDAPDQLTPTYENWTIRRESWLPPFPGMARYERDRQ